jgi:hypothetical protein
MDGGRNGAWCCPKSGNRVRAERSEWPAREMLGNSALFPPYRGRSYHSIAGREHNPLKRRFAPTGDLSARAGSTFGTRQMRRNTGDPAKRKPAGAGRSSPKLTAAGAAAPRVHTSTLVPSAISDPPTVGFFLFAAGGRRFVRARPSLLPTGPTLRVGRCQSNPGWCSRCLSAGASRLLVAGSSPRRGRGVALRAPLTAFGCWRTLPGSHFSMPRAGARVIGP